MILYSKVKYEKKNNVDFYLYISVCNMTQGKYIMCYGAIEVNGYFAGKILTGNYLFWWAIMIYLGCLFSSRMGLQNRD